MILRARSRLLLAGLATAGLLLTAGCAGASSTGTTASIPSGLFVEGYGTASAATLKALKSEKQALDIVGISGVSLTAGGAGVAASSDESLSILKAAHAQGTKAELLVNNIDTAKGDFSADLATKMLSSAENRDFVIAGLASEVEHGGYDGVQLDFEYLSDENAADLVSFVADLRESLPKKATISMALMASTTADGYLAAGYDLDSLKGDVDRFVLMAYDQHGAGFSEAGPVGGLPWAKEAVSALEARVPARKIDLGVAGYGYSWPKDGSGGVVTPAKARSLAGNRASWVAAQGEWTAKLANGTVLWWSDGRSLTTRANFAESEGLHGVALWQISTGDPIERAS